MLKSKVEWLETNGGNLIGKEFSDHLTESVKSKKSSSESFLKLGDWPFVPATTASEQRAGANHYG